MDSLPAAAYTFDVFVSYASVDRDAVDKLVARLKKDGFNVWWDMEQMAGGSIVLGQLADGILHSAHMIACLSDAYIDRDFTAFELQTNQSLDAANKQNRTIPVKVHPLSREIPAQIRAFVSCDLSDAASYEQEYRRVIAMIRRAARDNTPQESAEALRTKYEAALNVQGEPNLALFRARIAAESFARFLYRSLIGPPAPGSTLDALVDGLLGAHKLPAHIGLSLGTVQTYGNLAVQEGADVLAVTQASIQPGIAALRVLADWTFATYLDRQDSSDPWDMVWNQLPEGGTPSERSVPGSRFVLRTPRLWSSNEEAVYSGLHSISRQDVDIRLSLVPPEEESSFFEEISRYARLGAAAILRPVDAGRVVVNGKRLCVYVALEQVDGPSAEELQRRFGPLPLAAVCSIGAGIAAALEAMETAEPPLSHGSVTPSNIVVDRYGNVRLLCVGLQKVPAATGNSGSDLEQLRSTLHLLLNGGGEDRPENAEEIETALLQCENASQARTMLESAAVSETHSLDLRTVVSRFRDKRPLPEPAMAEREAVAQRAVAPDLPREFAPVSRTMVDATEAWPLGEGSVLVLERDRGTMAIFAGDELKWRDAEPIQYRLAVTGAGNRVAVGGWEGRLTCFSNAGMTTQASLWGTVGAIAPCGDEWLAGTWRNSLMRVSAGSSAVPIPPRMENGVLRIAVSYDGSRFAVADLTGAIAIYSQGRRVAATPPFPGLRSLAFCGRQVIVLANGRLTPIDLDGRLGASDPSPGGPSSTLVANAAGQGCLVIAENGQSWVIQENGAHLPYLCFAARYSILGFSSAKPRFTAAERGGCAYYRQDRTPVITWPDATSANVSYDGRWLAVRSPGKVSLYFDP